MVKSAKKVPVWGKIRELLKRCSGNRYIHIESRGQLFMKKSANQISSGPLVTYSTVVHTQTHIVERPTLMLMLTVIQATLFRMPKLICSVWPWGRKGVERKFCYYVQPIKYVKTTFFTSSVCHELPHSNAFEKLAKCYL